MLRGFSASEEGIGEGERGRKSAEEKITSGSRGGQSSWAYVNLAFEKDADLILTPGTLKKRKEEKIAAQENRKREDSKERKENNVEGKWLEGEKREEPDRKPGDTGTKRRSMGKETVKLKTFGSVRVNGVVERLSDNSADKKSTLGSRKSWISSKIWRNSIDGSVKGDAAEKSENERKPETAADVEEELRGFRLKHLTKEWDTDALKRGRKDGSGEESGDGGEGRRKGEDVHDKKHEEPPTDYDNDSQGEECLASSSRTTPVLLSKFSMSTNLLLSQEEGEEEGEGEEEMSRARTLDRGYSATLTREHRGAWREGQISFFDDGKKRDFNYFSAQ